MLKEIVLAVGLIASSYVISVADTVETYLVPQKLIYSSRLENELTQKFTKTKHISGSDGVFYTFDEKKSNLKYFPKVPKNIIDTFNLNGNETYEKLKEIFKDVNLDFDYFRDQKPQELEEKIRLNLRVKF